MARIEGALEMPSNDESFRALVLSNEQVFPPTREAEEGADEMKSVAFAMRPDAASAAEEFSAAQLKNLAPLATKNLVQKKLALFGEVRWCLDAEIMAGKKELRSKTPSMYKAGQRKVIRCHAKERLSEYEQHDADIPTDAADKKNASASVISTPPQP